MPIALLPLIIEFFRDKITLDIIFVSIAVFLFFIFIGFVLRLKWTISSEAFSYKYNPVYNKWRKIPLTEMKTMSVMKINPIKEFGGWGFRYGKLGQAFTTTGRMIIHIETIRGQKLNFSVENVEKTELAITKFLKNK